MDWFGPNGSPLDHTKGNRTRCRICQTVEELEYIFQKCVLGVCSLDPIFKSNSITLS